MIPDEYLRQTCHFLNNPRLKENTVIHHQFQKLSDYILGGDFDELVLVLDCYTTEVYPRYIRFSDCNVIAWDNHFWDIYGRFLFMYFTYKNLNKSLPQTFYMNYYKSMLLIYLANRFENHPAFARYLAEEYSKMDYKFPPYNEYEDINDILDKVGHLPEFNISKIFGFCHEVAHIAYRKKNTLSNVIQEQVIDYCEAIIQLEELKRKLDPLVEQKSNDKEMGTFLDIARRLLTNSDGKILEEVCCDIIAICILFQYFQDEAGMSLEEACSSLSSVNYFLLCVHWFSTSEVFWKSLYEVTTNVQNDDAFVNPKSPYYKLGNTISDEYAVRINFTFAFCNDKLGMKFDNYRVQQEFMENGFTSLLSDSIGVDIMDVVLNKTKVAKTDYVHAIAHQKKKNKLIGWENEE